MKFVILSLSFALSTGCLRLNKAEPDRSATEAEGASSQDEGRVVEATRTKTSATAPMSSTSSETQSLYAGNRFLRNAAVRFPAGSLSQNDKISVKVGEEFADSEFAASLGFDPIESDHASTPMIVESENKVDPAAPYFIELPLPPLPGASLQDSYERLIIVFKVVNHWTGKFSAGIYSRTSLKIDEKRQVVSFATSYYGIYQAVIMEELPENVDEVEPQEVDDGYSEDTSAEDTSAADSSDSEPDTAPVGVTSNATIGEDAAASLSLNYVDLDGDQATTCAVSALSQLTAQGECTCTNGTCTISVLPDQNFVGQASLSFTVSSNGSTSATKTATITVTNVNDAPTWSSEPSDQNHAEDAPFSLTFSATDVDGDPLTYSLDTDNSTCDDGSWNPALAINSITGVVTGTPTNADVGACDLFVQATDGSLTITTDLAITITDTNDVLTWNSSIGNFSINEDSAITGKTADAADVDPGVDPTYSLDLANMTCDDGAWSPQIAVHSSTGAVTGTPTNADATSGSCTVKILATSNGDTISETLTITVNNTNDAPVWNNTSLPSKQIFKGTDIGTLGVTVDAVDVDNGDTITYGYDAGGSNCAFTPTVNGGSGALTAGDTTGVEGLCLISVSADDGTTIVYNTQKIYVIPYDVEIGSINLWLDANKLTLSNNDPVASWTDYSGADAHAISVSTFEPTFQTNQVNSLPAISFNGSDEYLKIDNLTLESLSGDVDKTVVMIANPNPAANKYMMSWLGEDGGSNNRYFGFSVDGSGNYSVHYTDTGDAQAEEASAQNTSAYQIFTIVKNGTSIKLRVDGTEVATAADAAGATATDADVYIGARFDGTSVVGHSDIDIAEIFVYDTALDNDELSALEGGLSGKYAISYCGGYQSGGFCWYLSATSDSCQNTCANHGGYNSATDTHTGKNGTDGNCNTIAEALLPAQTFQFAWGGMGSGMGCSISNINQTYRGTNGNTTASASQGSYRRVCACNY